MAESSYATIPPNAKIALTPFRVHVPEAKLQNMRDILRISPIGPAVWENTSEDQGPTAMSSPSRRFGMRRDWLREAKEQWLEKFDWRKVEGEINAFPNFTAEVTGANGRTLQIQFLALFSQRADAIPIAFYHGWPGSILEFVKMLDLIRNQYTPATLPYHIVVPSLPGFTLSDGPPLDADFTLAEATDALHRLMLGLGFDAYLAQGGDIGSSVARQQAVAYDACRAVHVNAFMLSPDTDRSKNADSMTATERAALARGREFVSDGFAYGAEHGTRPATIGLALSSSPLALLAWVGEKFLEWSDDDPSIDDILASASLYWLTDAFPRSIYAYREGFWGRSRRFPYIQKPTGFSFFPRELVPSPKCWVEQECNLVAYYSHERGGHFAALENPKVLWADVEDWVKKVWVRT